MWRMADWKMSVNQRADFIAQCLDLGVSSFDHADIYGDYTVEALFGEVLAREPGWRHRMELVSKCGIKLISKNRPAHRSHGYDTSRAHIIASAEQSLRNLQTDYLDLLLIHRPDPLMDFAEVAQAFTELQQAGKVRHFGVSNFSTAQFNALNQFFPLVTNQIELSPLHLQPMFDGSLDAMQAQGVSPMLWSALAGGRLFGNEARPALRKVLGQLEGQYKMSEAGIVYAWLMQLPCKPLPLTGSSRIAAVAEAVQACHLQLPREQWFEVLQAARGREVD
ncbi:MAG: aldo/keto reductase [Burkholderiales bacterium]|nr:aldo/keto reductase [Burkholderiales bacterium]